MSAATLEKPATDPLPNLTDEYQAALKEVKAKAEPAPVEKVETKETPAKEPAPKAEPVKEEAKKEPVKEIVKEGKKKSALDAALADEPSVTSGEPDEVQQLIESKDPNWEKARPVMKRQSEEIKALKEQVSKASTPPAEITAKVKTYEEENSKLKEENSKLRDSIVALDVRFDPSVIAKMEGREQQVARLSESITGAGADGKAFSEAMALPLVKRGPAIDAILDGIESSRVRTNIETKLAAIEVLDEQLDEQLSKPHQSFEQLKQQRQIEAQKRSEQIEQFKAATFEQVQKELPKLSKFMRPAPEDSEGAAEYNAQLHADIERAPKLLEVEPREAAILSNKAARYDSLEKIATDRFAKDAARIAELEETVAKYEGAEPGFRGNGKPVAKAAHEVSIVDAYQQALDAQQGIA